MTTTTEAPPELPEDWRDWPPGAKMRLRWRLLTDWHPTKPRPNQLTPAAHALCVQPVADCEAALAEARRLDFDDPEERAKFLASHGHVDWMVWLILTGRGWGKTRVGAEDVAQFGRSNANAHIALIGQTLDDVRKTMVEGESGLLQVLHPEELRGGAVGSAWNRTTCELWLMNGTKFQGYSSEVPERLRGPQHHRAWADELAAWKNLQDTWDNLMFGLRLGDHPQVIITTTPKPKKLIIDLRQRPVTVVTRGSMYENAHNLAAPALAELKSKYEGTRVGRQELHGELIEEIEGALWTRALLDEDRAAGDGEGERARELLQFLNRVVVAVDPAVTATPDSDETGIIVAGKTFGTCIICRKDEPHALVLRDLSGRFKSHVWGKRVRHAYRSFMADYVVAEVNNGGDLVADNINATDPSLRVKMIHAKRGKKLRAQPVANLYEQHRVHHVGNFNDLEDQQCEWDPDEDDESPDRLDGLVYAVSELMIGLPEVRRGESKTTALQGRR